MHVTKKPCGLIDQECLKDSGTSLTQLNSSLLRTVARALEESLEHVSPLLIIVIVIVPTISNVP